MKKTDIKKLVALLLSVLVFSSVFSFPLNADGWERSKWNLDNIDEWIEMRFNESDSSQVSIKNKFIPIEHDYENDLTFYYYYDSLMAETEDTVHRVLVNFDMYPYANDEYIVRCMNIPDEKWENMFGWDQKMLETEIHRDVFRETAEVYNPKAVETMCVDPDKIYIYDEFPAFEAYLTKDQLFELAKNPLVRSITEADTSLPIEMYYYQSLFLIDLGDNNHGEYLNPLEKYYNQYYRYYFLLEKNDDYKYAWQDKHDITYLPKISDFDANAALMILRNAVGFEELGTLTDELGRTISIDLDFDGVITSRDALYALRFSTGLEKHYLLVPPNKFHFVEFTF